MTEITRIEELKMQIENKENFIDHNSDLMSAVQVQVLRNALTSMKDKLAQLEAQERGEHEFSDLSGWIMDEHCAMRIIKGGNPNDAKDRVAFIEKTPRVRLVRTKFALEEKNGMGCIESRTDAWIYGPKGSGSEYGEHQPSREWCDNLLKALGWE